MVCRETLGILVATLAARQLMTTAVVSAGWRLEASLLIARLTDSELPTVTAVWRRSSKNTGPRGIDGSAIAFGPRSPRNKQYSRGSALLTVPHESRCGGLLEIARSILREEDT